MKLKEIFAELAGIAVAKALAAQVYPKGGFMKFAVVSAKGSFYRSLLAVILIGTFIPASGCIPRKSKNSDLNALGFLPDAPPTDARSLAKVFDQEYPNYFADGYLQSMADKFIGEASYLGERDQIQTMALTMMQQWLYLSLYQRVRSEYLMMNYAQTIPLTTLGSDAALKKFDDKIPQAMMEANPDLIAKRNEIRTELQKLLNNPAQRQEARDNLKGAIESAYMSLQVLEARDKYAIERYGTDNSNYTTQKQEIDSFVAMIRNSYGLLATKPFTKNVEPYFRTETIEANKLKESAVNDFHSRFNTYLARQRTIDSLSDYLSGDEIARLGTALAKALQVEAQTRFRARIAESFDAGVNESLGYLDQTCDLHMRDVVKYEFLSPVVIVNTKPAADSSKFKSWLIEMFKEQGVHFVISGDYPIAQAGARPLTEFASQEMSRQSTNRSIRYAGMVAATSLAGIGTQAGVGWLGKIPGRIVQLGVLGTQAGLSISFVYDSVAKYYDWKNTRRLARINVSGAGLMNLMQENLAWKSMMVSFAMTGVSLGMLAITSAKYYNTSPIAKVSESSGFIRDVARNTWNGSPIDLKDWVTSIKSAAVNLGKAVRAGNLAAVNKNIASISVDLASIATQAIVAVPATLPNIVKTTLVQIPPALYNGVIIGTVMSVMAVTIQDFTKAQGIKAFTYAYEALGQVPPSFWKVNALNPEDKNKTQNYLMWDSEILGARDEIIRRSDAIIALENAVNDGELSELQKGKIRDEIAANDQAIKNVMRGVLIKWYKRPESRDVANSVLKFWDFGMKVTPNLEAPSTMILILQNGGKTHSNAITAEQIDDLINRKVVPDPKISQSDLDALLQATLPQTEQPK